MTVMDFYNMLEKEVDSGTEIDADLMICINGNIHILTGEYYKTNVDKIILVGKEKKRHLIVSLFYIFILY